MDKIEKIRAEIERRHAYQKEMYSKTKPDGRPNDGWAESLAIMGELEELRNFLDTLEEEPDKSLEEAAKVYVAYLVLSGKDIEGVTIRPLRNVAKDAFIAGANWQKEQMMKETVEGVVEDWNPEPHPEITIPLNPEEFTAGDKVKLIIVKKD